MSPLRIVNSLVTRMILFGVLLLVLSSTARYIVLSDVLRKNLIQVFSAQQVTLAQAIATDVDYKLTQRRQFLEQMARTMPPELLSQPGALRLWLQHRDELLPLFSLGLTVTDPQGHILVDYPAQPGRVRASVPVDADWLSVLQGHSAIGRPRLNPQSGQPALPMAAPVLDRNGHVKAILFGETALSTPGFLDRVTHGKIGETGGFLLISPRDKLFVAASDPSMALKPTPAVGVNLLHDRAMAGYRGSGVTINARGVEELSAMASVPSTGWFVVARLPTSEVLATIRKIQHYVVLSSWLGVLIVMVVVGGAVAWMLRPLHHAARQATRMTEGEIPIKHLPVVWQDEVGHMTYAFNRLLSKLASSQVELERAARRDALTGLLNRSLLPELIQQGLQQAQARGTQVALLFLDLDGFKPLNDTLGHEAGDEALREVARRLSALVNETDTLARVGGDEFVLLAPDLREPVAHSARALAASCLAAIMQPLDLQGREYVLGVSIGIALCSGACSSDQLLAAADKAMYLAKQQGRGIFAMAPPCEHCAMLREA